MIKYISKMLVYATLILGITSCGNDWLDVTPGNAVDAGTALTSSKELNTAMIGVYQILKGTSTFRDYYAARMFYYGEVRGEDMQADATASRSKLSYDMTYSTPDNAPAIWQTPYIVIGRANQIIQAVETGELTDMQSESETIARLEAESKVIRALAHFDLVRVYGKTFTADNGASLGVPVVTTPLDPEAVLPRNTVAEVYTQVVKDLTEAINSNALSTERNQGYVNVWAAKGILARVYLTQGNNAEAFKVAEDVIQNSPFELWTNAQYVNAWAKADGAHTNEMLFELVISGSTDWTDREGIAYLYNEQGYSDVVATQKFLNLINEDPQDVRKNIFLAPVKPEKINLYGTNTVYLNKFPAVGTEMRMNNVPIVRLSEIYLIAAEAAAKLGNTANTVKYLDPIVNRANPNNHVTEATATLERVLIERRKELIGEGHRFFDALRNNETVVRYTTTADQGWHMPLSSEARSFNRDYYKTLLPIPMGEINTNPIIVDQQNPGY